MGWLPGLQKLVQAGGDLMAARGAGIKNKTALHVAAEHCHAAVVEYIVNETEGALNLEEDSNGKCYMGSCFYSLSTRSVIVNVKRRSVTYIHNDDRCNRASLCVCIRSH